MVSKPKPVFSLAPLSSEVANDTSPLISIPKRFSFSCALALKRNKNINAARNKIFVFMAFVLMNDLKLFASKVEAFCFELKFKVMSALF
jgi:hypothetical protein